MLVIGGMGPSEGAVLGTFIVVGLHNGLVGWGAWRIANNGRDSSASRGSKASGMLPDNQCGAALFDYLAGGCS